MNEPVNIWQRLNPSPTSVQATETSGLSSEATEKLGRKKFWRIIHRLDAMALAFWAYLITKVFIADWDVHILNQLAPNLAWLLNFRLLGFIAAALLIIRLAGTKLGVIWLAYIFAWPIIILAWRVPRLAFRRSRWNGIVGLAHIATESVYSAKSAAVSLGTLILALLFSFMGYRVTSYVAAAVIGILIFLVLGRFARAIFVPGRFMKAQIIFIAKLKPTIVSSNHEALLPLLRSGAQLTPAQSDQFIANASSALMVSRATLFWAHCLNEYRRSSALIIFRVLSITWAFAETVLGFTLISMFLYDADQTQFTTTRSPSFVAFLHYAVVGMYSGDSEVIKPVGDLALAVTSSQVLVGTLGLVGILFTLVLSYRYTRDEESAAKAIKEIRASSQRLEQEFKESFDTTPNAAIERLQQLGHGITGVMTYLTRSVPPDWLTEGVTNKD